MMWVNELFSDLYDLMKSDKPIQGLYMGFFKAMKEHDADYLDYIDEIDQMQKDFHNGNIE